MKNRVIAANHLKQEISVSKRVFQQGKSALSFLLLFVANEVQLMKANVQSVVVSFVQNERNTLHQIDVIHLLIFDKDCIFFFLERSFSPKIFCLCLHSPLYQALLIKLEHIFLLSQRECRHYEYQFWFWRHYKIFIWFNFLILIASLKTQF